MNTVGMYVQQQIKFVDQRLINMNRIAAQIKKTETRLAYFDDVHACKQEQ